MAIQARSNLKTFFSQGRRPTGVQFADMIDSYYHKNEDAVSQGGWYFRSFIDDLRANNALQISGGILFIPVPTGATRLNRIRLFGRGADNVAAPIPNTATIRITYLSDIAIPELSPASSDGTQFYPAFVFSHAVTGLEVEMTEDPNSGSFLLYDTNIIDLNLEFQKEQFHYLIIQLTLAGARTDDGFGPDVYSYYGMEFA